MFRIGDFSTLAQVSVKTLHHYDDIGLLRPAHTAPGTGYRFYTAEQFARLLQIRTLKELGFSLEEIVALIDRPAEEWLGPLEAKRAEAARRLEDERARLLRIEQMLGKDADRQSQAFRFPVSLKALPAQRVVGIGRVFAMPQWQPDLLSQEISRRLKTLYARLGAARVRPIGPPLIVWYSQEWNDRSADLETALPIPEGEKRLDDVGGDLRVHALPDVPQAACVVYRKSPQHDEAGAAHVSLVEAIAERGLRIAGNRRNVILHYEPSTEARTVEVQFPVETRGSE